ncbi:beta-L-arabinofuranosidase domain-containing protein [Planctomyces sp. SH-PL62]|uniref:beta-L-arabinofuranosidase domain-containing protein n=1 Tax=Planctomyces sp. SH-PL62 TaxID=1636152 RepID=UPI00078EF042|nr:beta-L-arabinofuranosidase domain-containing protein [Planctomyces sp. SH-PL62]AMV35979.1 Non-reducing end beta-L-arabinofuranosidase [Planctomyces sp. SH-PL62]
MEPAGPLRAYLDAVTADWLLPGPRANPAILAMFADRDRQPYRDLLPWSGEFAGKFLTGAAQVYQATSNPDLKRSLEAYVRELLPLQDADGYFGPFPKDHRLTGTAPNIQGKPGGTWDAWGHYHMMLGLMTWDDAVGDPDALAAAVKIGDLLCDRFLGDKKPRLVDTGSTEMNLAPAHALVLLYEKTRAKKYLDLAKQIVDEFAATAPDGAPLAGDYLRRGLAGDEFFQTPKPRWESLHPMQALAALGRIENDADRRKAYANLWWSIAKLDRHNNGGFSSGEQAQGDPYHAGAIETCCTIAWLALSVDMLKQSGDPIAADELELSTLNSALGLFSPTGRWSTYNTPMDGVRQANYHEIVFQSRPGSPELNCCSVNAARGLGLVSQWALLSDDATGGLVLNWYGAGDLIGRLGGGARVGLETETDYPRSGRVRIKVDVDRPTKFALALRIPQWSTATRLTVGGEAVADVKPATYRTIDREWKDGDVIELDLDMSPRVWVGENGYAGRASLYVGPTLLAYDARLNENGPDDPEPIDARSLRILPPSDWKGSQPPIVLVEAKTADGKPVKLCDFASAGADGSRYRSWLRVEHASATPFSREHSFRTGPPVE